MAKIRGIKPEFWTDEDIVELSVPARLLFIGLWNLACDNGHVQDKPKQIKMRLLPADDVDVDALLNELEGNDRIDRAGGTITIHNFAKHQKPHRRWWTTCDLPLCTIPDDAPEQGHNRGTGPSKPAPQPESNRGTTVDHGRTTADVDCEVDVDVDGELISSASADAEREFDEWYAEYPRKRAKGQAAKAYRAARKKASAETLLQRLREQRAAIVARGLDYCPYPATWLNGERWNDEPPGVVQLHRIGVQPDGSRIDENGVRYLPDGSVDESTLPPVEDSWMKRRPR